MGKKAPVPFDESNSKNRFWHTIYKDRGDKYLPNEKGFITDMTYFLRGTECPTFYTIWSSLASMSALIKREAWIKWFPNRLYSNLYIILVGQPSSKKGSTMTAVTTVVKDAMKFLKESNYNVFLLKDSLKIIEGKNTPAGYLEEIIPSKKKRYPNEENIEHGKGRIIKNGERVEYSDTSECFIVSNELTSLINKQDYTKEMIEILTDIYDTHDYWPWKTVKRGLKWFKNLHTVLIGATTPDGLKDSIPKSALGGGFISRTIIVYQDTSDRRFSIPKQIEEGPTKEDLAKRLAWIAENSYGEYSLSENAAELYEDWYQAYRDRLDESGEYAKVISRASTNLLKIALLIRLQRYERSDKLIHANDLRQAIDLLNAATARIPALLDGVASDSTWEKIASVAMYLEERGSTERTLLMRNRKLSSSEVNAIVGALVSRGDIKIELDGTELMRPGKSGKEQYIWIGTGVMADVSINPVRKEKPVK